MDEETWTTATTARHAFVATVVALIVIVVAFALWKLKVVLALILLGITIAAAMRPGIDRLASWRIPRPVGLHLHYLAVLAVIGLFLSFVVPPLTDQVRRRCTLHRLITRGRARASRRVCSTCSRAACIACRPLTARPARPLGRRAGAEGTDRHSVHVHGRGLLGLRARAHRRPGCQFLPRPRRKMVRDTWTLIDQKLGAFVRGGTSC